jgi:CHASE2 domain-containing sensor protein
LPIIRTDLGPGVRVHRPRRDLVLGGVAAALLGLLVFFTGVLGALERDSVALRFRLRHAAPPREVAVVGIDSKTFQDLHTRWPFPRSVHAAMVDRLAAARVKEIVYDVQFTEPTSPGQDLALYRSIGNAGGAVLATGESDRHGHTQVLGGDRNLARINAVAGAANLGDDNGGVVTRLPYEISGLKTLAVAATERATGRAVHQSDFGDNGAWIDYRGGPGAVPTYSFADVLHGRVPARDLRGKIVVVGATAPVLQDVHATPTSGGGLMAGPEVEANAIWTALHQLPLRSSPVFLDLLMIALLGMTASLARLRWGVATATALAVAAGGAYAVAAQLAFDAGWIIPVTPAIAALAGGIGAMIVVSQAREHIERLRVTHDNELLERLVRERTQELRETQLEVIHRLGQAAESRDETTGKHIQRIGVLCERLGLAAGLTVDDAEKLRHASAMHDVGKIAIPDSVLLKPGPLDDDEWRTMAGHPAIGARLLDDSRSEIVQLGRTVALTHHERWDGSGYPAGLAGEEIPIEGRICAVCDVFDALLSERPYKRAWPLQDAMNEIRRQAGSQFDPRLVELFMPLASRLHADLGYQSPARSRPELRPDPKSADSRAEEALTASSRSAS